MKSTWLLITGILYLFALEILRVYFIMPFPGSQYGNTIGIAYFLNTNITWLRLLGFAVILPSLWHFIRNKKRLSNIALAIFLVLYGVVFYLFNFRFLADKMFYQPREKLFLSGLQDTSHLNSLVIGVALGSQAKAYPVEIIGYHHQVKDTIDRQPIMVTYCTVCRTGRVYSPFVDGKYEEFRLVGMDHFNAMFEDAGTKSWWQQATGIAIAGSLKGKQLREVPSAQMRLGDWLALHPNSMVLQPDTHFLAKYDSLKGYDEGTIAGKLEHRDTASWKFKSWVIGLQFQGVTRAYDWNMLVKKRILQDYINGIPILITLEPNGQSFYVFSHADSLHFTYDSVQHLIRETGTQACWTPRGVRLGDTLANRGGPNSLTLQPLQAYQEFWHSWQTFHPNTTRFQ